MAQDQKPVTFLAVPADALMAAINVLSELSYKQVGGLVPALQQCMSDEHRVDFQPQQPGPTIVPEVSTE